MVSPLLFSINKFVPFITFSIIVILSAILVTKIPESCRVSSTIYIGPGDLRILGMGFIRLSSGFSYLGFLSWSTYYVVHVLKVSPSLSGFYAFLASIMGGSVGAVIGGYLGDKVGGYALPSILSSLMLAIIVSVIPRLSIIYLLAFLMLLLASSTAFTQRPQ